MGLLTVIVSGTNAALVEDGTLPGPRRFDMGNSGLHYLSHEIPHPGTGREWRPKRVGEEWLEEAQTLGSKYRTQLRLRTHLVPCVADVIANGVRADEEFGSDLLGLKSQRQ